MSTSPLYTDVFLLYTVIRLELFCHEGASGGSCWNDWLCYFCREDSIDTSQVKPTVFHECLRKKGPAQAPLHSPFIEDQTVDFSLVIYYVTTLLHCHTGVLVPGLNKFSSYTFDFLTMTKPNAKKVCWQSDATTRLFSWCYTIKDLHQGELVCTVNTVPTNIQIDWKPMVHIHYSETRWICLHEDFELMLHAFFK